MRQLLLLLFLFPTLSFANDCNAERAALNLQLAECRLDLAASSGQSSELEQCEAEQSSCKSSLSELQARYNSLLASSAGSPDDSALQIDRLQKKIKRLRRKLRKR